MKWNFQLRAHGLVVKYWSGMQEGPGSRPVLGCKISILLLQFYFFHQISCVRYISITITTYTKNFMSNSRNVHSSKMHPGLIFSLHFNITYSSQKDFFPSKLLPTLNTWVGKDQLLSVFPMVQVVNFWRKKLVWRAGVGCWTVTRATPVRIPASPSNFVKISIAFLRRNNVILQMNYFRPLTE